MNKEKVDELNRSSFLVYTDYNEKVTRLKKRNSNIKKNKLDRSLHKIMQITNDAFLDLIKKLIKNRMLLNKQWEEKKIIDKVTSPIINKICKISSANGAYGTKLLGSGGGGFVLVICPPNKRKTIIKKLKKYKIVNFRFEDTGSTIIYKK